MKILLVTATYLPYSEFGAERAVRLFANALTASGYDVRVLTTCPPGDERVERIDDHDVVYVAQKNIYWSGDRDGRSTVAKVLWHIRDTRNPRMGVAAGEVYDAWAPDIVHTHILAGFSVDVWKAAALRGIPVVHTIHDYYLLCPKSSMFTGNESCAAHCTICRGFSWPRVRAARSLAAVTAPSEAVLAVHTRHNVFQPHIAKQVVQNVCPRRDLAAPLHCDTPGHIGFIGRLTEDKGVLQLLAWFQSSAMAARDLRLTIAGSGPLADAVQQAAVHDERIEYLGYVSPDVFFPRLSVLVVPSIWNDPSPVVIREAYAFGVPVVGSKCGGIPELVRLVDDRLVFDPFRSESLGRAVGVALDPTLRPRFRERAIAAMDRFTEARVVSDMAAIYRSVADDARR